MSSLRQKILMERRRKLLRVAACAAVLLLENTPGNRKSKRRMWKRKWPETSSHPGPCSLPAELTADDHRDDFLKFVKMTSEEFDMLLRRVEARLIRKDTRLRKAIPAKDRLSLTLRFLATGESFKSLSWKYRMGGSTVSKIILETCTVLHQLLRGDFLQMPDSEAAWRVVAEGFQQKCQFPHCVGALGAKHISVQASGHSSSSFGNNKEGSVLLTAAVDSDYNFLFVSVVAQDEASAAFLFEESDFSRALDQGVIRLPPAEPLPNTNTVFPYVFVGDDAFPLRSDLMTPSPCEDTDRSQTLFNHRLSAVHRAAENAFGILASRWKVFHSSIHLRPDKVAKITLAAVCLHNFLCRRRSEAYLPVGLSDSEDPELGLVEGTWRSEGLGVMRPVHRGRTGSCSRQGEEVRNAMKDFFHPP